MTELKLYGFERSPPVRACTMTLGALGLPFQFEVVNVMAKDHLKPDFLKKNRLHTVPVLEDGDNFITDSHVICTYLVQKYGSSDQSLYPKDLLQRSLVDQRLYFDLGVLFVRMKAVTAHLFTSNKSKVPDEKLDAITEAYDFLESFLENSEFLVGNEITLADICCFATVTSLMFHPLDPSRHSKTIKWIHRMRQYPFSSVNENGAKELVEFIKRYIRQQ